MKNTATKLFRKLRGVAMMLAVSAGITAMPMLAASNGIYLATAAPHYRHPVTGIVEDSGGDGSAVLGQSMTESATAKEALVEVDADGTTYITVRLKLMDNISDPQFQVDGHDANAELMQEDYTYNTADYRMRAASESSIIRCSMYVIPMGRSVVFYITVSDLHEGSGDFITSITVQEHVETPEQPEPAEPQPAPGQPEQPEPEESTAAPSAETTVVTTAAPETTHSAVDASETGRADGDSDEVVGLVEFDEQGNRVDSAAVVEDGTGGGGSVAVWTVLGVAAVAACGFAVWYFCFFRKKR